jgi:hypothetical protein
VSAEVGEKMNKAIHHEVYELSGSIKSMFTYISFRLMVGRENQVTKGRKRDEKSYEK